MKKPPDPRGPRGFKSICRMHMHSIPREAYGPRLTKDEKLKLLRKRVWTGLSINELAAALGRARQTVWGWLQQLNLLAAWHEARHRVRHRPLHPRNTIHHAPVKSWVDPMTRRRFEGNDWRVRQKRRQARSHAEPEARWLTFRSKWSGTCCRCEEAIRPGELIRWNKETKKTRHDLCSFNASAFFKAVEDRARTSRSKRAERGLD